MRARLTIAQANIAVELREVVLRSKPQKLLDISAKGTVPVILLNDGTVLDESLDIMHWALSQCDTDNWLSPELSEDISNLIQSNDGKFKYYLDRYKYADRYPQHDEVYYRQKADFFLQELEKRLSDHQFLCSENCSLADIAIFPFIRQFVNVDINWFQTSDYIQLQQWLNQQIKSNLFISIMDKYPAWQLEHEPLIYQHKPS